LICFRICYLRPRLPCSLAAANDIGGGAGLLLCTGRRGLFLGPGLCSSQNASKSRGKRSCVPVPKLRATRAHGVAGCEQRKRALHYVSHAHPIFPASARLHSCAASNIPAQHPERTVPRYPNSRTDSLGQASCSRSRWHRPANVMPLPVARLAPPRTRNPPPSPFL
jgi:hypothetical protein